VSVRDDGLEDASVTTCQTDVKGAAAGDLTLEMRRVVSAAPGAVFAAFSNADELAKWWARGLHRSEPRIRAPSRDRATGPRCGRPREIPSISPGISGRSIARPPRENVRMGPPHRDDVESSVELSFRDLGESTEIIFAKGPFKTEARRSFTGPVGRIASTSSNDSYRRRSQLHQAALSWPDATTLSSSASQGPFTATADGRGAPRSCPRSQGRPGRDSP
jgi:hypothetical protein